MSFGSPPSWAGGRFWPYCLPDSAELDPFRPALGRLVPEWRPPPGTAADESLVVLGEAVLRLLRVLAPAAGCLLVLEDLHWADRETLAGECFWPSGGLEPSGRAGHVPSAVHQPLGDLYEERGSFRRAADLRRAFPAVDLGGGDEVIAYCTIGGRASTAWFVLTHLLGRDRVRVYDGSWAEWGRMPDTPVEKP